MQNTQEFQRLDEEISFYLNDKNAERALVLHAAWGSGKTHLINEWLNHRRQNRPYTPGMVRKNRDCVKTLFLSGVLKGRINRATNTMDVVPRTL